MEYEIITRKLAKEQGSTYYFTANPCPKGHIAPRLVTNYNCSICMDLSNSTYAKEHREKHNLRTKIWREANPTYFNDWKEANPTKISSYSAKRRAAKLQAIPLWADLEAISILYKNCPDGFQVDHFYPLQSDWVCGLHVVENLRYLTPEANQEKSNRRLPEHA